MADVNRILEMVREEFNSKTHPIEEDFEFQEISYRIQKRIFEAVLGSDNVTEIALNDETISLLLPGQQDIMMNSITRETVKTIFNYLTAEGNQAKIEQFGAQIQQAPLSKLKESIFRVARELVYNFKYKHLAVVVGFQNIVIELIDGHRNRNILKMCFVEHGNGSRFWYERNSETGLIKVVDGLAAGIHFHNLAANEFIDIIKVALEPAYLETSRILKSLKIDIQTRKRTDPPLPYPSVMFFLKIMTWMETQQRLIRAESFILTLVINSSDRFQPFDLKYLNPGDIKSVAFRVWDDRHFTKNRTLPEFLDDIEETPQWRQIQFLDINDPLLKMFKPDLRFIRNVKMYEMTVDDIEFYRNKYIARPVEGVVHISSSTNTRHGLCFLAISINNNIMLCTLANEIAGIIRVKAFIPAPHSIHWQFLYY